MLSNIVRIVSKTFTLPSGELRTVTSERTATSRNRAEHYVKYDHAAWEDPETKEAIYFLDPAAFQRRCKERLDGNHSWAVRDCGGSKLVKAGSGRGRKAGVSGGFRVLQTKGGEFKYMDAA